MIVLRNLKTLQMLLWWANNAKDIATHVSMIVGLPNSSEEQAWKDKEWLASSGISWYTWNPLYFTDVTRTIHTSDFSHNYRNYGYEIMTKNEIQNILAEEDKKREKSPSSKFFDYNLKTKRHRMTYWKHNKNGMNFFKAAVLCDRLNTASKTRRLGGYHVFTHASLGYDINDVMKWGYYDVQPHVPEEKIKSKTQKLIADYIGKKLKHNYKNIDI